MATPHQWTFFSNHGHVLICLSKNADQPLREVALAVGITERAVQRIVSDLEEAGYLTRERNGRRNIYTLKTDKELRHPLEKEHRIGEILAVLDVD
ncbi:helix-turn-helix transcriptional regulator [Luteolibacter algae]|uniref:Helix-turn-helix transcriptional regulator n=1 Tax=Luteolibacter algae TaxID=454151 RepID=A0ABW5D7N5_9BACT